MTDGYCDPADWDTLTRDEQQYVFTLREARDSRRNVSAVTTTVATNETAIVTTPAATERGIGATMSRRDLGGRGDPGR